MNLNLNKKLMIMVIPVLLITCFAVIFLQSSSTSASLYHQANLKLDAQARHTSATAEAYMQNHIQFVNHFVEDAEINNPFENPREYELYLNKRLSGKSEILTLYMYGGDNVWIDSTLWVPDSDYIPTTREWYIAAVASSGTVVSEPYVDADTKQTVVSISRKIVQNGKMLGVAALDITIDELVSFITGTMSDDGSYSFIADKNGKVIAHPIEAFRPTGSESISLTNASGGIYREFMQTLGGNTQEGYKIKDFDGKERLFASTPIPNTSWFVVSAFSIDYLGEEVFKEIVIETSIFFLAVVAIIVVLLLFSRMYFTPIVQAADVLKSVAHGDLSINTGHIRRNSKEMNQLITSLNSTTNLISTYIKDIDRITSEMAKGSFDVAVSQHYIGDYSTIESSLTDLSRKMSETLSGISVTADQVSNSSAQVSSGANALAHGATEQAASVSELSSSINKISARVKINAEKAAEAKNMADSAKSAINLGNEQMQRLVAVMNDIDAKSTEIKKIIKTIEDIAFQTNVLALNASVEAARAGAAGKGFAVVAGEVRNLAAKSSEAAKDTTNLIESSVILINQGVSRADITAKDLLGVVESVSATTDLISDISAASNEQAQAITQITTGLDSISAVVQTNSSTSEQSAAASEQLSSQASLLKSLISKFKYINQTQNFQQNEEYTPLRANKDFYNNNDKY